MNEDQCDFDMSHKRKDTSVTSGEWAQHLRPDGKRQYHKAERRHFKAAADDIIKEELSKPAKKKKVHKRFGTKQYWSTEGKKRNISDWNWYRWYTTEKARDQAYDAELLKINRYLKQKKNGDSRCMFVMGDIIEKVEK